MLCPCAHGSQGFWLQAGDCQGSYFLDTLAVVTRFGKVFFVVVVVAGYVGPLL